MIKVEKGETYSLIHLVQRHFLGRKLELDLGEREDRAGEVLPVTEDYYSGGEGFRPEHQAGREGLLSKNSLVARLLEEQAHAGWDTVEGFYIWRVIGLFPATLLDSLGGRGGLRYDERCDPKTQQKERKNTFYTSVSASPSPWPRCPRAS